MFEDYLIALVKHLSQKKWNRGANTTTNDINNTATDVLTNPNLLYLATALGLSGFIHVLFQWFDSNPSQILEKEIDFIAQDPSGFTPLVRLKADSSNLDIYLDIVITYKLRYPA